jgi:hypothetical protein
MLTNKEIYFLFSLQKKYNKIFYSSLDFVDRVILAIEIIEKAHRNIVWRFFEYIYIIFSFLFCYLYSNKIKNLSIGIYQIKISFILDYLNIEYILDGKIIKTLGYKPSILTSIIKNRNNKKILYRLINRNNYSFYHEKVLNLEKLESFILDYSHNLSFNNDFNYFFVLRKLINLD